MKTYLLVEAYGILLGLDVDDFGIEFSLGYGNGVGHNEATEARTTLSCYDSTYGNFGQMGGTRAYAGHGQNARCGLSFIVRKPDVDGLLVVVVEVLIYIILLYNKDLATCMEEGIEFVNG